MAPKNKNKGKDTTAGADASGKGGGGKLKPAMSINVRHILCEKHSKKQDALKKLEDGERFDKVAEDFSEDKRKQGGSLGWKQRINLVEEFAKVAFELEPSTTAKPIWGEVKTEHGYHIIMVEGRK